MLKTYLTNIHRPKRLSEIDWENNLTVVNRITISFSNLIDQIFKLLSALQTYLLIHFFEAKSERDDHKIMADLQTGDYDLNHGLQDHDEIDAKIEEIVSSGEKFTDEEFDIADDDNAGDEHARVPDQTDDFSFIGDGHEACDIAQGGLGDCWFLSALSSLAQDLPEDAPLRVKDIAVQRVLQPEFNNSEEAREAGIFKFKFFRLGEWIDVIIDDDLPTRKRARPSDTGEWWVPLVEKAYAKFSGSYEKIQGGNTCWALQELSGGITVELKNLSKGNAQQAAENAAARGISLFKVFYHIQNRALICTSNLGDGGNDVITNGLVHGHAYSLLRIDYVMKNDGETVKLVKIRNPWAQTEWTGEWSDHCPNWEEVSDEEKERIDFAVEDDGGFYMNFEDWIGEFEMFTICMLPRLDPDDEEVASDDEARARDRRVIGTFVPGESSPVDVQELQSSFNEPSMHVQAQLKVDPLYGKPTRFVWIQFLLDSKLKESRSVIFNL
ncbi:unnamed protein product [Oikopleura dioica]|uniref:Calpain catalytic domain-containing protein n=1 Tax=Oikopleura dioica TaxID=34765 RepID=E4XVE4_OIKDI|nr:unnamed protein product [Oikopleura dioica]